MLTQIKDNQITFTDARFYIDRETGEYYPSATTILEAYPKPYALLQWMKEAGSKADEIRDAAGRRGSLPERFLRLLHPRAEGPGRRSQGRELPRDRPERLPRSRDASGRALELL